MVGGAGGETPVSFGGEGGAVSGGGAGGAGEGGQANALGACHQCEQQYCATQATDCEKSGPTCRALLDCVSATGCANGGVKANYGLECYCGTVEVNPTCIKATDPAVPQGVCKAEYEAASGETVPANLVKGFSGTMKPLSYSTAVIKCYQQNCAEVCNL